ncbi:MAG: peptide deformylase [Alphaproteobacteria bacterium]|jgi:peptide deformylase
MAILSIIIAPDPRLKVTSELVGRVDSDARRLMDDMLETMYLAPGIGLSAVQVGVPKRLIVMDVARKSEDASPLRLADPEIIAYSDDAVAMEEGCLSFPEHYAEVKRPDGVNLRYTDEHNQQQELAADGLLARCIQHEIDHLDGILLVDHLSAIRRGIIIRKLLKARKAEALKSA